MLLWRIADYVISTELKAFLHNMFNNIFRSTSLPVKESEGELS